MRSLKFHAIAFSLTASLVVAIPALAAGSAAEPNWYTPRLQWMMDAQSFAPLFNALNIVSSTDPETMDGTTESGN